MYIKSNMGFFNFIETFFFISLGITFVLILLLVYHFKQRICTLEQKGNTMFEIVNGVVKELTNIKKLIIQQNMMSMAMPVMGSTIGSAMGAMGVFSKASPQQITVNDEVRSNNIDSDSESGDEESESGTDDEESESGSELESDLGLDSDSESYSSREKDYEKSSLNEQQLQYQSRESEFNLNSDNNNEYIIINDVPIESNETENIKIINYQSETIIDEDELDSVNEDTIVDDMNDSNSEESMEDDPIQNDTCVEEIIIDKPIVIKLNESDVTTIIDYNSDDEDTNDAQEPAPIQLDDETLNSESVNETPLPVVKDKEESYKRLNLNQLKATVIAKGITTDISKLKKNELIKLLANSE